MATTTEATGSATYPAKGERFQCGQCGMEIEIITECNSEHEPPQFICCGEPLDAAAKSFLTESKEAFVEQMQTGLEKTKDTVAWLSEKAAQAKDATKEELSREADVLSRQYDKLRDSLGEVKDSSSDAWKDVAKGCSESWQRFKAACEKAVTRYR